MSFWIFFSRWFSLLFAAANIHRVQQKMTQTIRDSWGRERTGDQSFIFTPKKGFCCRQRESIAFSSAANLLFSFIFLDGLKFYAGHILLYSEFFGCRLPIGYVSQVNRISTGEPLHNKYLRVLQSSQSWFIQICTIDFQFFSYLLYVCVYDSRDSVSPRRRTVIQSRLGAIKLTRYVYPIDIIYPRQQHTHKKKTDWLEQKTTQIGVALLFSRVSFRINGTVSIEFTFKIRARHFFRSSLISFVSEFPVVEINESVSRIFFSYRK